jgi:hypothetical protein
MGTCDFKNDYFFDHMPKRSKENQECKLSKNQQQPALLRNCFGADQGIIQVENDDLQQRKAYKLEHRPEIQCAISQANEIEQKIQSKKYQPESRMNG